MEIRRKVFSAKEERESKSELMQYIENQDRNAADKRNRRNAHLTGAGITAGGALTGLGAYTAYARHKLAKDPEILFNTSKAKKLGMAQGKFALGTAAVTIPAAIAGYKYVRSRHKKKYGEDKAQ